MVQLPDLKKKTEKTKMLQLKRVERNGVKQSAIFLLFSFENRAYNFNIHPKNI
jgi:hypothetical protein